MRRRLTLWQWLNVGPFRVARFRVARGGRPASTTEITEAITKAIGRCPRIYGLPIPQPGDHPRV